MCPKEIQIFNFMGLQAVINNRLLTIFSARINCIVCSMFDVRCSSKSPTIFGECISYGSPMKSVAHWLMNLFVMRSQPQKHYSFDRKVFGIWNSHRNFYPTKKERELNQTAKQEHHDEPKAARPNLSQKE